MGHNTVTIDDVSRLADAQLMADLQSLCGTDRALTARLLVHLGEVQVRGLYRARGFSSMFAYAVHELRMSESVAYHRIHAAQCCRQFPLVLPWLASGHVHLTTIKLLAPHLTQDNHARLLEQAKLKTKREVERIVASLAPKPDAPTTVRKLPERVAVRAAPAPAQPEALPATVTSCPQKPATPSSDFRLEAPREVATPLRPGRYKIQFTAGQELHDKLEHAKNLLRHRVPSGDLAVLVEQAMDLLIETHMKKRFAQTKQSRPNGPRVRPLTTASRYIPRDVVRAVHARDGEQCAFVSADGRRCQERGHLELHHDGTTFARGGAASIENLKLVCRAHNAWYAERDYGRAFMQRKLQRARLQRQHQALGRDAGLLGLPPTIK